MDVPVDHSQVVTSCEHLTASFWIPGCTAVKEKQLVFRWWRQAREADVKRAWRENEESEQLQMVRT